MRIFIASSGERLNTAIEVGSWLESMNVEPVLWNEPEVFPLGVYTWDALIDLSKNVDAAVFIFGEDDKEWGENAMDKNATVRDNVLFEYGLFCGALGKSKVCIVRKGKPKIASDLNGVTYINGDEGELTIKRSLQDWLDEMK